MIHGIVIIRLRNSIYILITRKKLKINGMEVEQLLTSPLGPPPILRPVCSCIGAFDIRSKLTHKLKSRRHYVTSATAFRSIGLSTEQSLCVNNSDCPIGTFGNATMLPFRPTNSRLRPLAFPNPEKWSDRNFLVYSLRVRPYTAPFYFLIDNSDF